MLVTLSCISQTAIHLDDLIQKDTTICLPKKTMHLIIQDLEKGDFNELQVEALQGIVNDQSNTISLQESRNTENLVKIKAYELTLQQKDDILRAKDNINLATTQKYKKVRRQGWALKAGIIVLAALFIIK